MKKILCFLTLCSCLAFTSGCAAGDGSYVAGTDDGSGYYSVSNLYGEGVDDSGNMWFGISGSFNDSDNNVEADCDGQPIDVTVETESSSLIEVSTPANSQYANCNFSVYVQGQAIGTVSETNVTPMEITDSTIHADPNPAFVDVTLQGDFFVQPLTHSELSVLATCNGGATAFSPQILDETSTTLTLQMSNPGLNQTESCDFEVQDTFPDEHNNAITVSSPDYQLGVSGA